MFYNDEIMKPLIYSFGVNPNLSAYLILLIERKVILTASLLATVKTVSRFSIDILVLCYAFFIVIITKAKIKTQKEK